MSKADDDARRAKDLQDANDKVIASMKAALEEANRLAREAQENARKGK